MIACELDNRLLARLRSRSAKFPTDELCDYLGCSRRQLQKARERLEEDWPVLSDQFGYWFTTDPDEYQAVLARDQKELKADARRYAKRRRCMRRNWPSFQPTLFEIDEVA